MYGLRAVRLLEHVVVTGGRDDGYNFRNEVTFRFFSTISDISSCTQVLQYEETTGAWSEIGKMKKARWYHAVVAVVDVSLFCPGIVGQTNKK